MGMFYGHNQSGVSPLTGNLSFLDSYTIFGNAYSIATDGEYIFVPSYLGGLITLSFDSGGIISAVDSDTTYDKLIAVYLHNGYAYTVGYNTGIHTFSYDSSGLLTYVQSDTTVTAITNGNIWGDGSYLYVAGDDTGLHTYSIDGSGAITYIDTDDQGGNYYDVKGDGTYLYVASNWIRTYTHSSGILTHEYVNTENTGVRCIDVANYVYGTDAGSIDALCFSKASGVLTRTDSESLPGSASITLGVLKYGDFVFASGAYTGNGEIYIYNDNGSGQLTYNSMVTRSSKDYRRMVIVDNILFINNYSGSIDSYRLT